MKFVRADDVRLIEAGKEVTGAKMMKKQQVKMSYLSSPRLKLRLGGVTDSCPLY